MVVRRAMTEDIDQIITLTNMVADKHGEGRSDIFLRHPYHISLEKLERDLKSNNHVPFVAENEGIIIGVVLCTVRSIKNDLKLKDAVILSVEDTCVSPICRGKKIGTALIEAVKLEAQKLGCQRIETNVWAFNKESMLFFEENGFEVQKMTMEYPKSEL